MIDLLAHLVGRHRGPLAGLLIAFTLVCLYGASQVTFETDVLKFLESDELQLDVLEDDFAHLEQTALIVVQGDDLLTPASITGIHRIVQGATESDGVTSVYSLLNLRGERKVGRYMLPLITPNASPETFDRLRERSDEHPLLIGHLLSDDWKTALVVVELDASHSVGPPSRKLMNELKALAAETASDTDLRIRLTGPVALAVEIVDSLRRDIARLSFLGISLVLVIAGLLFRRLAAVVLVVGGPMVGATWTLGVMGLIGEPINVLTNIVPLLVLVIGFTDAMHLVLYIRRSITAGMAPTDVAQSAVQHLGLACGLTSITTAVGFGSLVVAKMDVIQTFGWSCAVGSVLSFIAVITVVPLLASTRLGHHIVVPQHDGPSRSKAIADWILDRLLSHRRLVLGGGLLLSLVMAALATRLEPDYRLANEIPNTSDAYQALAHVDQTFGGVLFAYGMVQWPDDAGPGSQAFYDVLSEVHAVFEDTRLLTHPLSFLNMVQSLPGAEQPLPRRARQIRSLPSDVLRNVISFPQQRAIVSAHMPDAGAHTLNPVFADVERRFGEIQQRHAGFRVTLTGANVSVLRSLHVMIEDLWKSLLTASVAMFLMIWLGLRSLRYALISILPNTFPLLCAAAFLVLSGRHLEMSSVIVFSISLGIAVDDTIHFLARFRHENNPAVDLPTAIRRTYRIVGTALVMTTVALVAGHGIVMLSGFPAIRVYGMMTSLSIAAALAGDLLILPALLACVSGPHKPSSKDGNRSPDSDEFQ